MYRQPHDAVDDRATLHSAIRNYPFATIARARGDDVEFAYAPVVLDEGNGSLGGVRFHLARANPVAAPANAPLFFSFRGPDAYVSPDWYISQAMVPTWNYVVVQAQGTARVLDKAELYALLADLSAQEEARLAPKPPWTLSKVPAEKLETLIRAIVGYSVRFDRLRGKFKLSCDKPVADFDGVRAGLRARGDAPSLAVEMCMTSRPRGVRAW